MKIKLSKSQWKEMGRKAGWIKTAGGYGRFSEELSDIIEGQALYHREKTPQEIVNLIKGDKGLRYLMREEAMTDTELIEIIEAAREIFQIAKK